MCPPKLFAEMLVECCSDAFATAHLGGGGCARAVQIGNIYTFLAKQLDLC